MVTNRLTRLNLFILSIIIAYAIGMVKYVSQKPIVNPIFDYIIVFLTSVSFHEILKTIILILVEKNRFLQKIYWGKSFLDGFWSYAYTVNDPKDNNIYFGIWRFEQTLFATKIVGFGLNPDFTVRSRVRSVTDLIKNVNRYEVINIRTDHIANAIDYYSRTSMYFELNKDIFFRHPIRMRGETVVYGGPLNGRICNNFFLKHNSAKTEEDVINELKENVRSYGKIYPDNFVSQFQ